MASKLTSSVRHKTVPREFEGGLEHETTDKDDVKRLFSEVRQNYSAKLADDDEYTLPRETSIKDAQNAISEAIETNLNDANAEKEIYCASCSTEVRVEYVSRFARGQHISMPGEYSKSFTYRHHAIVREVIERSGTRVTLELIEFNKKDLKKNIYKSTKTFNLKYDDMCIIEYTHPRYTADKIVQRAEEMLLGIMTDETEFGAYILFSKKCEHFATWCADEDQHTPSGDTCMKDAHNALDAAIENRNDANAEKDIFCASCWSPERVDNVSKFARGQHISMPEKNSKLVNYRRHAIVRNVIERSGTRVTLELIKFIKQKFKKYIFKSTKTFNLKYDDMCIIEYTHPRYTADEIVQRAEAMLPEIMTDETEFGAYNPFSNNCEHFATWCVVGEGKCLQLHDIRHTINENMSKLQQILNGSPIFRYLYRLLLNSTDEIGGAVSQAIGGLKQGIVLGVTAGVYLLYCIIMTRVYIHDKEQGHMCRRCLRRKLLDMWLDFSTFCVGSTASYLIIIFAVPLISPGFVFPLTILVILLAIGLQWSVSKVYKMLQSPFPVDKTEIRTLSEIDVGDVISMKYWGIPHDMIVTEICEQNKSNGTIQCVHYSLPTWNIFGTRKILEEWFQVDLTKDVISKYDCRNLLTYKKEVVVSRAKKRVGETKWNMSSNRSDHVCYWAKVKQFEDADCDELNKDHQEETELKTLNLSCLDEKDIHLFNELQPGDAIKFAEWGILVRKTCLDDGYGRLFEIEIIFHTFFSGVQRKKYEIDLNKHTLMVRKYHPAPCLPMEERVQRALIAEKQSLCFLSTIRFLKFCILFPTSISL